MFDPGYNLHAFDNSDKVFRVSQRLQDSPRLTSVASFPALENVIFLRAWQSTMIFSSVV